jgi:hypothetical protein
MYNYSVYAVTSEGNGAAASNLVAVGGMCNLKIVMADSYGDGWNGAFITVYANGQSYGTATCVGYNTTATILIPSGDVDLVWTKGQYDSECSFQVYNAFEELLYSISGASSLTTGFNFFSYYNDCNPRTYVVRRDGGYLATVDKPLYLDTQFDPYEPHTWSVQVFCPDGGVSEPTSKYVESCKVHGDCSIDEELIVTYQPDCTAELNWGGTGGKSAMVPNDGNRENFYATKEGITTITSPTVELSPSSGEYISYDDGSRAMWDIKYAFNATAGAQVAIATDGTNWYTGSWSPTSYPPLFCRYSMTGANPQPFNIPGVALMRSLTYDGTYFYAGNGGNSTTYKLDLANQTLVGTITSGA